MNVLDIVLGVIVLLGLARGFQKGLIKSFIGLVGWIVALIAASKLASSISSLFVDMIESPQLRIACGFLLVVLVAITVIHLVGMIAEKIMAELNLSIVDRFLGGVLGAAKGVMMVLILLSVTAPVLQRFGFWSQSIFVPQLLPLAPIAMQLSKDVVNNTVPELIPEELSQKPETTKQKTSTDGLDGKSSELDNDDADDISLDEIRVITQ